MAEVSISILDEGFTGDPKTGWSAYPFLKEAGFDIRAVHVVAINPGQVRGNHYHARTSELLLMFSGTGAFYWEEGGAVRESAIGGAGAPVVIRIPPGKRHAFRNTGVDVVYLLAVRDGGDDHADPDIVRSPFV